MLGFIVGTACLFGVIKLIRGWRHGCGYGGYGGCGGGRGYTSHQRGGCGSGGWRRHHQGRDHFDPLAEDESSGGGGPVLLRGLFERLQTTPGQERVIAASLQEIRAAFKKAAEEKGKGAKQVAEALRGDDFKTENMAEAFAHLDSSVELVRDASFSALAKIHEALDERQRKIMADLIGRGGRALENLAEQA